VRDTLLAIKEYQHLTKMTSTFLLWDSDADKPSEKIDANGVAHPEYRPFGTGTGRLAGGSDKSLDDRRVNAYAYTSMNMPEETRSIYVPHATDFEVNLAVAARATGDSDDDSESDDELADDVL
jgi:hypothetical protein